MADGNALDRYQLLNFLSNVYDAADEDDRHIQYTYSTVLCYSRS
jgi:hypothetical protein